MFKKTIIEKKPIAAYFMLLLLLFIQGVKLFHHHDHTHQDGFKITTELSSETSQCDICDYHFAKSTTFPESFVCSIKVTEAPQYFNFYRSRLVRSIGLSYSDRGPPTFI